MRCHPDQGGSSEEMQAINRAWSVLGQADRRAAYDAWLLALPSDRPEDVVERLAYQAMERAGETGQTRDDAALAAAERAWEVLGEAAVEPDVRSGARVVSRQVHERRRRLPAAPGTALAICQPSPPLRTSPSAHQTFDESREEQGERLLLIDLNVVMNSSIVDDFTRWAPPEWHLVISGQVFAHLEDLACSTASERGRANAILKTLNGAAQEPPARRRVWTETQNNWGLASTTSHLLEVMGRASALVVADSPAEELRLRAALRRWGERVRVGGIQTWAQACGREVWERRGGLMQPRRTFRQRSQRGLIGAGYVGLGVLAGGPPAWLWAFGPVHPSAVAWLVMWVALAWALMGCVRTAGHLLSKGPLGRLLARWDGQVDDGHRGAYWLGLALCTAGSAGIAMLLLSVGLWVSAEQSQV